MSRGDLQEMEVGTKQSKTAVNASSSAPDPMSNLSGLTPGQTGSWEDLGGPTPENYRSDDDSAKLKTPEGTLKQVRDVVNKGAKSADPMKGMAKEDADYDEEDEELLEAKEEDEEEEDDEDEDDEDLEEEFDLEEDVNALLGGEELSEEFREKAKLVFESALRSKIGEIKESLEIRYAEALVEEIEEIKEALNDRVDSYLEYVADEWFAENTLSIEKGLKEELT